MPKPPSFPTVTDTFRLQLPQWRKRRGWNQQQLADALGALGHDIDRATIAKIERTQQGRNVYLEEWPLFAAALGVNPVDLLFPLPDAEGFPVVEIASGLQLKSGVARQWIMGETPLSPSDERFYFFNVPDSERLRKQLRASEAERIRQSILRLLADESVQIPAYVRGALRAIATDTTDTLLEDENLIEAAGYEKAQPTKRPSRPAKTKAKSKKARR